MKTHVYSSKRTWLHCSVESWLWNWPISYIIPSSIFSFFDPGRVYGLVQSPHAILCLKWVIIPTHPLRPTSFKPAFGCPWQTEYVTSRWVGLWCDWDDNINDISSICHHSDPKPEESLSWPFGSLTCAFTDHIIWKICHVQYEHPSV